MEKYKDFGLLILRIGLGAMFMNHGYGKLTGGPEMWEKLGSAMTYLGIGFAPQAFGLAAALAEFGGGMMLIVGLLFRPACAALFFTMLVASVMHLSKGDGLNTASHAIELGIVFFSLILIGPGKYALDEKLKKF